MKKSIILAFCAVLFWMQSAVALPVIPGATGFGVQTPAGRGGQIIKVTNLNNSGAGSLRDCINAEGPRICVFEVAGNINYSSFIWIKNPNITIAGQTAPHPGITILGAGIRVNASDVLIQHIAIRPGDREDGPPPQLRDALVIGGNDKVGTIENIVIDHCSFSWSIDELVSTTEGHWDKLTIRNSVFAYPLDDSFHSKTEPPGDGNGHGLGMNFGEGEGRADIVGSLFAHARARNPRSKTGGFVFRNNVVYNHRRVGTVVVDGGFVSMNDIVGNVYIDGADTSANRPINVGESNTRTLRSGSSVYESGNIRVRADGTTTGDVVLNYGTEALISNAPLYPGISSQVVPVDAESFVQSLALNVGRRPATRDADDVDSMVVRDVMNRTGRSINCVEDDGTARCQANGGGWPADITVQRELSIPSNPNGDDDGDGYTNVEEWLHGFSAEVENGGSLPAVKRPQPPAWAALN